MHILADSQKGKTGTGFVVGLYCLLGQFPTTLVKSSVLLLNTPNEIVTSSVIFFLKVLCLLKYLVITQFANPIETFVTYK